MAENRRRNNPSEMTVTEQIAQVKEQICDEFCKYTDNKKHGRICQETLEAICEHDCPLRKL